MANVKRFSRLLSSEEKKLAFWRLIAVYALCFCILHSFMHAFFAPSSLDLVKDAMLAAPGGVDKTMYKFREVLSFLVLYVAPVLALYGVVRRNSSALVPFLVFRMLRVIELQLLGLVFFIYEDFSDAFATKVYLATVGVVLLSLVDAFFWYVVQRNYRHLLRIEAFNDCHEEQQN